MKYDDGLDADGYPLPRENWRKPYIHGSEADAGDFKPATLTGALDATLARIRAAMSANEKADSPIESILGAAIVVVFQKRGKPLLLAAAPSNYGSRLLLVSQFQWSIYRSDWAIYNPKTSGALLIECDGKDFHSSPDQMAHDHKKDLAAQDRGFLTMRFTGAQIHKDADGCADKIFDLVYGARP